VATAAVKSEGGELRFSALRGDGAALLAFDVDQSLAADLAGFAIGCAPPEGDAYPVLNRLSFEQQITAETTPAQRTWTPSSEAPIQKFHWIHYPKDVPAGTFTYSATAMLFKAGSETELEAGPSASVSLELRDSGYGDFKLGFTRGYLSSQAYAERFDNAAIEPASPTIDFDTAPYQEAYRWLGSHARKLVFELIEETAADPALSLDVFAYDFDEPDIIAALAALGPRLRLYLDNSSSHIAGNNPPPPREVEALAKITASAGAANVEVGHFSRYAHDKVLIQKRGGEPVKVLAGSANFSVRGLYVQSNNVFVFEDAAVAALYEQAFSQAFEDAKGFSHSPIASGWFPEPPGTDQKLPSFQVSFAPHADPEVSLAPVAAAIEAAKGSVLFAIMEIGSGTGPVLDAVRALPERTDIYAFGTTQRLDGSLKVTSPGNDDSVFIPFSYLHDKVPAPFQAEISGGSGQVIHHKFVVVDFNGDSPVLFAGSSNLAAGGEHENGDNLLAFHDKAIAATYAVEAIRLVDHYRFREAMSEASAEAPLQLATRSDNWTAAFFEPGTPKYRERMLFAPIVS
jgi:phosphatidylserine/phosphatidylglycerophosphate/cardiolipin synthase-like enzyme